MGIYELITNLFGGGLVGLIGGVITRWMDYKNKQLDIAAAREKYAQEVALKKVDAEIMAAEWAARTKVAEVEAAGRESVADAQAFAASFNEPVSYSEKVAPTAGQGWLLVLLDCVRGIVRPALTIYLCAITTMFYLQARWLLGNGVDPDATQELLVKIVDTVLFLTTSCVLWWFGTRVKSQPPSLK